LYTDVSFTCLQIGNDKRFSPDNNYRALTDVAKTGNIIAGNATGIIVTGIPMVMTEDAIARQ
jgi:hypothetical protein